MIPGENLEFVKRGFELFEREGMDSFETLLALADPQIECYAAPGIEPEGRYQGREDALRWWREWFQAWKDFRMRPQEFIQVSDDVIVVPLHQVARGKQSDVEVWVDVAYVFEIRDGVCTRFHIYPDREQALEAAARMGRPA